MSRAKPETVHWKWRIYLACAALITACQTDALSGVSFECKSVGAACDDGNPCTTYDHCVDSSGLWPNSTGPAAQCVGDPVLCYFGPTCTCEPDVPYFGVRPPTSTGWLKDNGDGTATDSFTHVIWQKAVSDPLDRDQAIAYCQALGLGGASDWRLPTNTELASIIDLTTDFGVPELLRAGLSKDATWYHSATWPPYVLSANFGLGTESHGDFGKAKCVRTTHSGVSVPTLRYEEQSGTVHDHLTGLVWERDDDTTAVTHDAAVAHCASLTLASGGWRLPTFTELISLANFSPKSTTASPDGGGGAFGDFSADGIWTSTPSALNNARWWAIDFHPWVIMYTSGPSDTILGQYDVICVSSNP